jgi:Carboxypeptidase regulatory-like domain
MIRRTLFGCLLTAILSSCSAGTGMFGPSTGTVTGHVQIRACGGAARPQQTGCPTSPDAGVILTFLLTPAAGKGSEKTVTTDPKGAYRVVLAPGTYTVRVARPSTPVTQVAPGKFGGPAEVTVTADKTVTADFAYTIELL